MLTIVLLSLIVLLTMALMYERRRAQRPPPPPDPSCWRASPAEPWATLVLCTWVLATPLVMIGQWLGIAPYLPAMLVLLVWGLFVLLGVTDHIRRFEVTESGIEWHSLRGPCDAPYSDVVAVSRTSDHSTPPWVWLSDGYVIHLPDDPGVHAVLETLTHRIGQP